MCSACVLWKKPLKKKKNNFWETFLKLSFMMIIYFGMAFIFEPSSYIYRTSNNGKENVLSPTLFFFHICMILQVRPVLCIVAVTYPRVPTWVLCKCYLFYVSNTQNRLLSCILQKQLKYVSYSLLTYKMTKFNIHMYPFRNIWLIFIKNNLL